MGSGLAFCLYSYKRNIYFYNVIASPERAWQSAVASEARQSQPFITRSPRRFAPRNDSGIIAFVLMRYIAYDPALFINGKRSVAESYTEDRKYLCRFHPCNENLKRLYEIFEKSKNQDLTPPWSLFTPHVLLWYIQIM